MQHSRRVLALAAAVSAAALTLTTPAAAATPANSEAAQLRAAMNATVAAGASGVIARYDDSDEITALAVGSARLAPRRAVTTTDQARVGSITKTMVATVVLQLVGEGRLRLSDTVEHWLPGIVPDGDQITIHMLLQHTSGIFNYTDDAAFIAALVADPYQYVSPQQLIDVANSHPRSFPPGTSWSYSNTGYILIGLILQKATGATVQSLLWRRVIEPLHLSSTYFATTSVFRGPYAHGYFPPSLTGGAGYVDTSGWTISWAWAAGAVVSNAPDLARFYAALLSGRLLKPALLRQMLTTVPTDRGVRYGLGILSVDTGCGIAWGHDGGVPGYVSFAITNRQGTRSAVVLLPTEPDDAIGASANAVLAFTVCGMFDRSPVAAGRTQSYRLAMTG